MVKSLPANAGDTGDAVLIPESGSYSGVGNGNLLQYSTLGNPMVRGAWWAKSLGSQRVTSENEKGMACSTCFLISGMLLVGAF